MMKLIHSLSIVSAICAVTSGVSAQPIQGLAFSHQDWEIYCSNTGTCRAAGYQSDEMQSMPASILLTRQAGTQQAVHAEFALAEFERALDQNKLKNIHFYLNDRDLGKVAFSGHEAPLIGSLNKKQVNALLQQVKNKVRIVFKNEHYAWQVSDTGMTAVLLKMDEFQKRGGTFSALVNKGTANESQVLAPQAQFSVTQIKTTTQPYLTLQPNHPQYANLHQRLMAARPKQKQADVFCEGIYTENKVEPQTIELYALSNHKILATTLCWRGAYNVGYGAWVLDRSLTGKASFVTEIASDVGNGQINSAQKGRGIGDCWSTNEWIWNGQHFIQTLDRWSGMCKGLAAGGVWELDRIEAIVK